MPRSHWNASAPEITHGYSRPHRAVLRCTREPRMLPEAAVSETLGWTKLTELNPRPVGTGVPVSACWTVCYACWDRKRWRSVTGNRLIAPRAEAESSRLGCQSKEVSIGRKGVTIVIWLAAACTKFLYALVKRSVPLLFSISLMLFVKRSSSAPFTKLSCIALRKSRKTRSSVGIITFTEWSVDPTFTCAWGLSDTSTRTIPGFFRAELPREYSIL